PGAFEIIVMNKDMIWKWFVGRVIDWVFRHIIADNRRTRGDVIDNTIFEYLYVSRGKDHDTSPRRYFPDNITLRSKIIQIVIVHVVLEDAYVSALLLYQVR